MRTKLILAALIGIPHVQSVNMLDEFEFLFALRGEVLAQSSEVSIEQPLPHQTPAANSGVVKYLLRLGQDLLVLVKALLNYSVKLRIGCL
jgi:hypothetical protein